MTVPLEIMIGATQFLANHPRFGKEGDRRAVLLSAGLDDVLVAQIDLGGSPFSFLASLIDALGEYGNLVDGRDALAAFLEASKQMVGVDGRDELENFISAWNVAKTSLAVKSVSVQTYMRTLIDKWVSLDSPLLPEDQHLADIAVGLQVVSTGRTSDDGRMSDRDRVAHYASRPHKDLIGEAHDLNELINDISDVRRWLLLGDPGSGKTTLLIHEASRMAELALERPDSPIPVLITLSALAARMAEEPGFSLYEYLDSWGEPLQIGNLGAEIRKLARRGQIVFMFDGADEVSGALRERVSDLMNVGVYSAAGNRVIVTSRRVGAARFTGYTRLEMAELTIADQRRLMLAICGEEKTKHLLLEIAGRGALKDMAKLPMMLTVLALVARESTGSWTDFLERQSDLFRIASRLLLEGRHRNRDGVVDSYRAERVLSTASYILHAASTSPTGNEVFNDIEVEDAVASAPSEDLGPWRSPREFVQNVSQKSNIIYPVDSLHTKYQYLHRTIREFYAASEMARYSQAKRRQIVAEVVGKQQWAEVLVLLGGLVSDVDDYLQQLFGGPPDLTLRALKEVRSLDPTLAVQFLQQHPMQLRTRRGIFVELARKLTKDKFLNVLLTYLEQSRNDVPRAALYFVIDSLRSIDTDLARSLEAEVFRYVAAPPSDLFSLPPSLAASDYWCDVPEGHCLIGAKANDPEKVSWVPDLTEIYVPRFEIGRVPITNVVYEHFDPAHRVIRDFQEELELRELDNHPVVGVSWYEAEAFCEWASTAIPGIRLPTEVEWEKAASWTGDGKLRFPWGDKWDSQRLNTWESGPNRTTPVGSYPTGASPVGAFDMAGNVWEWCIDWFIDDLAQVIEMAQGNLYSIQAGDRRVDRGGGWYHDVGKPTTFIRAADDPTDQFIHCGFRVARSSIVVTTGIDLGRDLRQS